jgi:hypothetical protein
MNKLKNNITLLGTFLSGVVGHHYIGKILDYKSEMAASKEMAPHQRWGRAISDSENMGIIKNKLNNIIKNNENLSKNVETLIDKHVPESLAKGESHINELLDFGGKQCKNVREILDKGPDNINLDFYPLRAAYKAAVACEKANREASEGVKKLIESINGSNSHQRWGSRKRISDFNLEHFYEYLNSLNLLELSALYHIIVLVVIAILSFNVLSAVLGNEIIKYFKLEENFPKLAAFLRLRLKFQKYYLTLSFSLIFLLIFASIQINLLVLF